MTGWRRWVLRGLATLAVLLPAMLICVYFINPFGARSLDPRQRIIGFAPYRMPSSAMLPTLEPGSIVIVRAGAYREHGPARGDIVVFSNPADGNHWLQRVIGLPGETVSIEQGRVLIDGRGLSEDYVDPGNAAMAYSFHMEPVEVPENSYLLMGDNRDNSMDGRLTGPIHGDALVGQVVEILAPE
ncbi:signal peptidase I [Marilutibacter chinensis]|uniref:Signal peptidase I n=1 Tax=Marilutibacter chinensis TaxID=2912247 RepID=A0ABS9HWV9_9GAMM|nr:signal peptidase I [Lysobacter chinensis]MCF7222679.1 signal peptidase I [Lysobacter chinensis]